MKETELRILGLVAGGHQNIAGSLFEEWHYDPDCKLDKYILIGMPLAEGCDPSRFQDYALGWDGEDRIEIDGPDGCDAVMTRRGD